MNKLHITIFLLIISFCTQAQSIMPMPRKYLVTTIKKTKLPFKKHEKEDLLRKSIGNQWIVFADRAGVVSDKSKELGFMEAFYVIEETVSKVHLVKYKGADFQERSWKLKPGYEDYGWVYKRDLILWSRALLNGRQFTVKALLVSEIESLRNILDNNNQRNLKFYDDPDLLKENENFIRFFQFLYVLKETEEAVLLTSVARELNFYSGSAKHEVLGWVDKSKVKLWNQRVVMEPSMEDKAITERQNNRTKTSIFSTKEAALSYQEGGNPSSQLLWNKDLYGRRHEPEWKRLPILEEFDNDIIRTGVATDLFNERNGQVQFSAEKLQKLQRRLNAAEAAYRNVNVVFVLDGTQSMDAPISAVVKGLQKSIRSIRVGGQGLDYKIGAVVYRDYPERDCPSGDRSIEIRRLTSARQADGVANFLGDMVDEALDCRDRDTPEAMYMGLDRALRMLEGKEYQSNIIILVGDAGNRTNDDEYNIEDITRKLEKVNCSLLAFQAQDFGTEHHENFRSQVRDLMVKSARMKASNLASVDASSVTFRRLSVNSTNMRAYELNYPEVSPVFGVLVQPNDVNVSSTESTRVLEEQVVKFVETITTNKNNELVKVRNLLRGGDSDIYMSPEVRRYLDENMGLNYEDLRMIYDLDKTFQLYVEGYTSRTQKGLNYPLYDYMLIANQEELENLRVNLRSIWKAGQTETERKKSISDAIKKIVATFYGQEVADDIINKVSVQELMRLILDLPIDRVKNCPWPNRLSDPISEAQLRELTGCVKDKYSELALLSGQQDYLFQEYNLIWYWVPQILLP